MQIHEIIGRQALGNKKHPKVYWWEYFFAAWFRVCYYQLPYFNGGPLIVVPSLTWTHGSTSEMNGIAKSVFFYAGGQCTLRPIIFYEKCDGSPI